MHDEFVRYQETRDVELRDWLVAEHTALAFHVAAQFVGRGIERDDLRQIALMALVGAVERFDPARGISFSSFAVPTMSGAIKHSFRQTRWVVRPPRAVQERSLAVAATVESLGMTLHREPTIAEIAAYGGWTEREAEEAMAALLSRDRVALEDASQHSSDRDAEDALGAAEDRTLLEPMLAQLEPIDRAIVRWYFEDCLTQREIGRRVGVCQMQVSRRLQRSLAVLRKQAVASARLTAPASP
jgi:RNA polymerase sigma-B factor